MKVAMLAPVAWRTPPRHYGPWERVTSLLTEGLIERGVDVTLFATADSRTAARSDPVVPHGYEEDDSMDGRVWETLHVAHAIRRSAEFDLVHSHADWLPLALGPLWNAPVLTTVHGFSGPGILPAYMAAQSGPGRFAYVSISDADRAAELDYVATVHHGIDFAELPLEAHAGDDLVVFGRIHPDKGTADAIEIARRTGRRLVICGIVQDAAYFEARVRPFVDGDRVVYRGSVGPVSRAEVLGAAAALLHPVHFDEPFGLSVVEALACGTPVIAFRRGAMPEVIDEGATGFVVDGVDEAVAAVSRIGALTRPEVRARAIRRFGVERMVDDYLRVYARILAG